MYDGKNLIVSRLAEQDMLDLPDTAADEAEEFILRLAGNPFSPALLADSVDNGDHSYYHRLPSGCYVSWEIFLGADHPRFKYLERVIVRVTAAKFSLPER
jgi:hypothetical protein